MEIIFLFGAGQAFFFSILLLRKKAAGISDRILAAWLLLIGIHLTSAYSALRGIHYQYPFLISLFAPYPLLHGPLLWTYVQSLVRRGKKLKTTDLLHFLPFAAGVFLFLPVASVDPGEIEAYLTELEKGDSLPILLFALAIHISGLVYATWVLLLLKRHQKHMPQEFSFEEGVSLSWLRYLAIGLAGIWLIVFLSLIIQIRFELPLNSDYFIFSAVTIFVFLLGYNGIRQGNLFVDDPRKNAEKEPIENPRYQRSGLKSEQAGEYYAALLEYMKTHQPYLDSRLSLSQLAEKTGLSPNHLSQLINEKTGQNFYQFINSYRIEAFKENAADPARQHLSLLAIALDCGFNSKSSFNQVFKKMTGLTPSDYLLQGGLRQGAGGGERSEQPRSQSGGAERAASPQAPGRRPKK